MQPGQGELLFSRYQDGARPVRVVEDGWQVAAGDGSPVTFTTAQALLAELTGHPTGRHWGLDRYFKLGRYAPRGQNGIGQANVLDLFPPATPTSPIVLLKPLAPAIITLRSGTAITVPVAPAVVVDTRVAVDGAVGIDLVGRGHEVRKLLYKGFGRRMRAARYDPEDVLQEVYKGLLARNKGRCPWNPSKSSFGHYVYMVCSCVLSNYHRKQKRVRQFEQSGLPAYVDGQYVYGDAASNTSTPARETAEQAGYLMDEATEDLVAYILSCERGGGDAHLAVDVLPYVVSSTPRALIAEALGTSMAAVSRAISHLRKSSLAWRHSLSR
jgi:hypothetical protein